MYNEKRKESTMKYLSTLTEIRFRVKPEEAERFRKAASEMGYPSMRQFYLAAVNGLIDQHVTICKSSGCHYFNGFDCSRSPVVKEGDEKCPCDKEVIYGNTSKRNEN